MSDRKKLIAWGLLGGSLIVWIIARHQHPMVTPVLLGVTVLVLLRELEMFRGRRLPLYAGIAVMIANAFLTLDQNIHLALAFVSMALLAISYFTRDKANSAVVSGDENSTENDT